MQPEEKFSTAFARRRIDPSRLWGEEGIMRLEFEIASQAAQGDGVSFPNDLAQTAMRDSGITG